MVVVVLVVVVVIVLVVLVVIVVVLVVLVPKIVFIDFCALSGGCDLWTMLQERQEDEEAAKTNYPLDDDDVEENILGQVECLVRVFNLFNDL